MGPYLQLLRPQQWIKNLVVLAGPILSLKLLDWRVAVVFAAFCLISSAQYALNDVADREADRAHPQKAGRPVASGAVAPSAAVALAIVLLSVSIWMTAAYLPSLVTSILVGYFVLLLAYSVALKYRPILDVIVIAVGFVLRAAGGAAAVDVFVSPWLIACTFTLCMFLGFGKRRCELATFNSIEEARAHRATLVRYTPELLNHLISVSAGIAIMTFLIYTMDTNPAIPHPPFAKEYLLYTLPLVAYGCFRYAMLIESGKFAGPTEIFLQDKGLILTGLLWGAIVLGILLRTQVP